MLALRRISLVGVACLGVVVAGCPGPMPDYDLGAGGAARDAGTTTGSGGATGHGGTGTGAGGHGGAGTGGSGGHGGIGTGGSTGTGGHGGSGTGGAVGHGGAACVPACTDPVEPDCEKVTCDNGKCKSSYEPISTKVPDAKQTVGDCQDKVCDGKGNVISKNDDLDVPNDNNDCTTDVCSGGVPKNDPVAVGTACANNAQVCDATGTCVPCNVDGDCNDPANPSCDKNKCVPAACGDGKKNGNETDLDCGGSCNGCDTDKACIKAGDCLDQICTGLKCAAPMCNDGSKSGDETDVDCGGAVCAKCAGGKGCSVAGDCASGACKAGTCDGGLVEGPSCQGGLTCAGLSCCDAPVIPGGAFMMGRSAGDTDAFAGGNANEQPEHNATVADFRLDTFEVTVGRFRKFVNQFNGTAPAPGAGAHPLIAGSGWQAGWNASLAANQGALISNLKQCPPNGTWTDAPGANETYAINCVSWYEAFAFSVWDGGRMPTEAEWEYAAAGGSENRLYPWASGAAPDNTLAVFNCMHDGVAGCTVADMAAVGSTPAGNGKWGHRDLVGGMWEWVLDLYDSSWYSGGGASCGNCANLVTGSSRVHRGGSWNLVAGFCRAANRGNGGVSPDDHSGGHGFRSAR